MAGWKGSDRKSRLPKDWPKIRQRIFARDGHQCTWLIDGVRCTMTATDCDHIRNGDDHSDSNLQSLCGKHHRSKSSAEGGRSFRRRSRYRVSRPAEEHPGIRR